MPFSGRAAVGGLGAWGAMIWSRRVGWARWGALAAAAPRKIGWAAEVGGSLEREPGLLSLLDLVADMGFSEVVDGGEVVVQAASEGQAAFGVGATARERLLVVELKEVAAPASASALTDEAAAALVAPVHGGADGGGDVARSLGGLLGR